jgi:hypothetical protein
MFNFLWTSSSTGKASSSKIWTHIAYAVATYIILTMQTVTWEILLVYMAIVGGSEIAKRLLTIKYGGQNDNKQKDN